MADYSKSFQIAYDDERDACSIRFRCFDTPNSVTVFGVSDDGAVERLLLDVRRTCLQLHRLWSFSLEGSDIWRVNQPETSIHVDLRTAALLAAMQQFHQKEPSFDFTVGPVSYLWKHAESVPSPDQVADALAHVGADKVRVQGDVVLKADPLVQVDVGGAAKGFAADVIVAMLRAAGATSADVDLGGNLFMVGSHPQGRPWRVSVRVPQGLPAEKAPVIQLCDKSVVTSGSYERFVELDGKRYQHIVNASTGMPSESDLVSATAVADSSLAADMLATTALLGGSKGLAACKSRHPDVRLIAITMQGEVIDLDE